MGEEQENKTEKKKTEEKKPEENKKTEQEKKIEEEEEAKPEAEEKKEDDKKPEEEIVLRVFMHCEGCARKVRNCLKNFPGVGEVSTDCKSSKVVVKGGKADPLKVLERVQKKSRRKVELLCPVPKPQIEEDDKKPVEETEKPKPEEQKEEAQVITVMLNVHMHCEACAQEIQKRIMKMKGVESAEPDLKKSQVKVTGVFDPPILVDHVYKRTGKHAVIVIPEPENKKEGEDGDKDKKVDGDGEKKDDVGIDGGEEGDEEIKVVEMKRNDYYYFPAKYGMEYYSYPPPPQMFSDENPNACSVM